MACTKLTKLAQRVPIENCLAARPRLKLPHTRSRTQTTVTGKRELGPRGQERQQLASRWQSAHEHQGPLAGHRCALVEDLTGTTMQPQTQLQLQLQLLLPSPGRRSGSSSAGSARGLRRMALSTATQLASYRGQRTANAAAKLP